MAVQPKKVTLLHGDSDYLIFKDLKERKAVLQKEGTSVAEFFGSRSLNWDDIYMALQSSDLFVSSSAVIIRDISDGKSFFPFVEHLTEYLNSASTTENNLIIVQFGKVLKTSKLYKAIDKVGEIKEFQQPKPEETLAVIKKSMNITDDGARLLLEYSGGNLFQIRNEIKKLQGYLVAKELSSITAKEVELLCIKSMAQNDIWGIGSKFLYAFLDKTPASKKELITYTESLIENNVPVMQILYSFYQYTLNGIKMKRLIASGKGFRECMAFGYFFAKEFFDKRDKMKLPELFELNGKLLDFEFKMKSGDVEEMIGLRKLLLSL
jgi:DNA polymerase III delta subunit